MDQQLYLRPTAVIMQPETLCNLDCTYCYLPFRHERNTMALAVARAVAASVRPWAASGTVEVCWHGGEPLATGRARLGQLMDAFAGIDVKHVVQTNATLIDEAWCEFFAARDVHVGVSIDGPPADNASRVDRRRMPTQAKALRGVELLRAHGHKVHAIAVVSDPTPKRARRLYAFALECGIAHLGVNIEEQEGVNVSTNAHRQDVVTDFWTTLAESWRENPACRVRELERALGYASAVLRRDSATHRDGVLIDPLPTVGHDGSVTLISPELAGFDSIRGTFSSGNVLHNTLNEIIERSATEEPWVSEFFRGVKNCRLTCPYFDFCGGGHPANRYFEHGRMDGTATNYCRNSKISLLEGVLRLDQSTATGNQDLGVSNDARGPADQDRSATCADQRF
ncbi:cyclophane-forming radical SAM peptide maturase AmcB [Lentzea sp.]|uniref:cyclophane-forming radical SAM peptide maturase AmcB n=1 Tax=Lentzea sp. TaxID=56099 RepID=UPI002C65D9F1|nr:cyclophane-forming radical SAM peptide maturase AmcB [Lentzea sp.]HUQ56001.1 cyclophane-forming radical SAM peptide maturase AmcB [Lentzea sp.]